MLFSDRLRDCRVAAGLTQKEAGESVGVKVRQWQEYEAGKKMPTFDRLLQIADCFAVSIDYLVGKTDDTGAKTPDKLVPSKKRRNWHFVVDFKILQSSLPTPEKFLYVVLQAFLGPNTAGAHELSFPSNEELSFLTGYPMETIFRLLKSLEEKGIISKHEQFDARNGSAIGMIHVNDIPEEFLRTDNDDESSKK